MHALELEDVSKQYGNVTALDGVDLTVPTGATMGLVGTNGAGKTTLFRILTGLESPDSGTVRVLGASPAAGTEVRERVGYLPERAAPAGALTGREVLGFHARMRGVERDERARRVERVLRTVGLADAADRRVEGYSNGMCRRLGLGTALVGSPSVLLLDEPTAGLDPQGVDAFHAVVERLTEQTDVTVVFSTHALDEVDRLCDAVAVLVDGVIRRHGDVASLVEDVPSPVSVTVTVSEADRVASAASVARDATATSSVSTDGTTLTAACDRETAFPLLDRLQEDFEVTDVEVHRAGVEDVVRAAIDGGGVEA